MTDGVFGLVIDYETLRGMPEYRGKTITQADVAKVARDEMASGGYDTKCRAYVEDLKNDYGVGIAAMCTVYNATGDDLNYILAHDYHGHIYSRPYPLVIKNGQWGGWLHVHGGVTAGSSAGIVYRGKNNAAVSMDWLLTWSIPFIGSNKVYTEIRAGRHYEDEDNWDYIQDKLTDGESDSKDEYNGCKSDTIIGDGTTTAYTAIMTLTGP